jgi:hypothetical protein
VYQVACRMNTRNGRSWFRLIISKLRREKKVEDVPYVYRNGEIERNIFFLSQWLNISEEVGYWELVFFLYQEHRF